MAIQTVGVIGAGTTGNGIAHVFARSGHSVVLCDVEQKILDRALATIAANLDREVSKSKITVEEKSATVARIRPVLKRDELAPCAFVVEAASERFELKAEIFRDLDR
ncbi:MAG TPA: 3-hydroxyacyl-CoA dehydrogenase NAD-binding domain-containing protein, partial [Terriglobales bacterium]